MIGERLGTWIVEKEIGRGGMGRVYLATGDPYTDSAGQRAAVKVLSATLAQDERLLQRFQREIEILRQLDHPGIVRLYEWGCHEDQYYYVMEYVDGRNVGEWLEERGRLHYSEVLPLVLQVLPALKHAHDHGVIHRDLKPSNLLQTRSGAVKLTDFGIARVFDGTPLTTAGIIVGTVEYLSPEQAAGKPATKRSDLYALGVMLYALLTGRPPFEGTSPIEVLQKHRFGQFDPPHKLVPGLPYEMSEVICQLLEKDPGKRPEDAMVLHRRLDSLSRKLARKAEQTEGGGRHMEPTRAGSDHVPPGSTIDLEVEEPQQLGELVRAALREQERPGLLGRLLNRAWVLAALLVLVVGVLAWAFWPPSAEGTWRKVEAAMQKDPPEWARAEGLLDEMDRRFPDHAHQDQARDYRRRIAAHDVLRQGERAVTRLGALSEGEWFYLEGLRLRQRGRGEEARRTWRHLIDAFGDVTEERPWVELARKALDEPDHETPASSERWQPVRKALEKARQLRREGKPKEAQAVNQALDDLYGNDPATKSVLEKLRREVGE